uniref:non-specific serine/threonine protein kinase n=1 Tax=Gongylonema pulchrum TaxID=637853 RepID=A0A183DDJ8_9BILA
LYENKFPVPKPIDVCRHLVVMEFIEGDTLCHVQEVEDKSHWPDSDYFEILCTLRLKFQKGKPVLIDMPQMVSMDHPNAQFYFERDVNCIRTFFRKRYASLCDHLI